VISFLATSFFFPPMWIKKPTHGPNKCAKSFLTISFFFFTFVNKEKSLTGSQMCNIISCNRQDPKGLGFNPTWALFVSFTMLFTTF
jgi:hypothetical protein